MEEYTIEILDRLGNRVPFINGVTVDGPAFGAIIDSFNPTGCVLDGIGHIVGRLPIGPVRNGAIGVGSQIQVTANNIVYGQFVVTTTSITIQRGALYADFDCPDLLHELARVNVTSGFATASESSANILAWLLSRQTDVPWYGLTEPTPLDVLPFSAYGISAFAAMLKLVKERGAHLRREQLPDGNQRYVHIFAGGDASGIWLTDASDTPNVAHATADLRQIVQGGLTYTVNGAVVNDLTPSGGGDGGGAAVVSLAPLYGDASFAGYDPSHPVLRRLRGDATGTTAADYDYYLEDPASISAYGRYQDILALTNIAPVAATPGDYRNAAIVLYQATLVKLQRYSVPQETIAVQTDGWGDLRNIAGKTVHVQYIETNSDDEVTLTVNDDYWVVDVERKPGTDGATTDVWTLSSNGMLGANDTLVLTSSIERLDSVQAVPKLYPGFQYLSFDDFLDVSSPIQRTFFGIPGVTNTIDVEVAIFFAAVRSVTKPKSHSHGIPALTVAIPAIKVTGNTDATTTDDGGFTLDVSPKIPFYGPAGSPSPLSIELGSGRLRAASGGGGFLEAIQNSITTAQTTHHHALKQLSLTASTATSATTSTASTSATEVGMEFGLTEGPAPIALRVLVDGAEIGRLTASGRIPTTVHWPAEQDHTLRIESIATNATNQTGLGRVYGAIITRDVISNVK